MLAGMQSFVSLALALSTMSLAGCYDSHLSREGHVGPGVDGSVGPDGGGPLPPLDGGGPLPFDGGDPPPPGRDGGPPPPMDAGRLDSGPPHVVDAGPPPDAGPPSRALRFSRGDLLHVAHAPTLDIARAYTLELWLRVGPSGNGSVVVKGDRSSDRYQFGVAVRGDEIVVGWGAVADVHELRAPIPRGVWTHVAMIVSAADSMVARLRLMLDGAVVGTAVFPNDLSAAVNDRPLIVAGSGFEGDVDELRLWRLARRPDGVRASMHTRISGAVPGLEAYWPLEERGQLAIDWTSHGHEGVLGRLTTPDADDPVWILDGPI